MPPEQQAASQKAHSSGSSFPFQLLRAGHYGCETRPQDRICRRSPLAYIVKTKTHPLVSQDNTFFEHASGKHCMKPSQISCQHVGQSNKHKSVPGEGQTDQTQATWMLLSSPCAYFAHHTGICWHTQRSPSPVAAQAVQRAKKFRSDRSQVSNTLVRLFSLETLPQHSSGGRLGQLTV